MVLYQACCGCSNAKVRQHSGVLQEGYKCGKLRKFNVLLKLDRVSISSKDFFGNKKKRSLQGKRFPKWRESAKRIDNPMRNRYP